MKGMNAESAAPSLVLNSISLRPRCGTKASIFGGDLCLLLSPPSLAATVFDVFHSKWHGWTSFRARSLVSHYSREMLRKFA